EVNTTSVAMGTYNFTINGYDLGHSHGVKLTLLVLSSSSGFTITPIPSTITLHPGTSSTLMVNLTSINNFFGNTTLTATSSSPGLTTSWTTQAAGLKANATVSTSIIITASNSMPPGTYSVTVSASCNGLILSITITVVIPFPPDFTIALAPSQLTVQ